MAFFGACIVFHLLRHIDIEIWANMPIDKKHEFMKEAGGLCGNSLVAMKNAVCTQALHQQCSLLHTGTFFDSADLADRYRNEPEKLICLKATANSFICPFRGVKMYEEKINRRQHVVFA